MYYPMDVDDVPAVSGSRPDRLLDVCGPQERVQRHTVDQTVDAVLGLPTRRCSCAAYGRPAGGSAADRDSHRPAVVLLEYGWVRLVAAQWAFARSPGGGVQGLWYVFFSAIQFPRQSAGHSSCATEGRFHSAVLEQGCCRCCVRQLPMVPIVQSSCVHRQGRRHPWFRTVEVPQIQSSTEFNDDFEAGLANFADSPERG